MDEEEDDDDDVSDVCSPPLFTNPLAAIRSAAGSGVARYISSKRFLMTLASLRGGDTCSVVPFVPDTPPGVVLVDGFPTVPAAMIFSFRRFLVTPSVKTSLN